MKTMAAKGKTVLCTIHQPSSQVFAMFDQLCLLAEGRTAYMGKATEALPFLEKMKFVCPEHFNPADFIIKTLAVYPGREEESRRSIKKICDAFAVSPQAKDLEKNVRVEVKGSNFLQLSVSSSDSVSDINRHK
jgi:ABC-type multidrug transport system ATPase subunit